MKYIIAIISLTNWKMSKRPGDIEVSQMTLSNVLVRRQKGVPDLQSARSGQPSEKDKNRDSLQTEQQIRLFPL